MILYVKHIGLEGPETLGAFLARQGFSSRTIEAWDGEPFPEDLSGIEAVVSLGGPMNVYEEEKYPFLKQDHRFIQQVLQEGVPFLGICLGAQLLAKASGAKVSRAREEEIGFFSIRLTEDGVKDPLLQGAPLDLEVFQWHGDTFDIPAQSAWLIRGAGCPHQAFRVGRCAYGLQFHIEVTGKNIREWSEAYWEGDAVHRRKKDEMLSRYDQ
ncbi:MAG TPA: type 1 glutamine amidotransferase, partial [Candidatus Omnitrophota bacterium]|nr:type 1 glutamine amidotransferase [Candidatus Omnitrophota bacterium]